MDVKNEVNGFFAFLNSKLQQFPKLTRGEQVSFISIGLGTIFLMVGLFLFIL